MPQPLAPCHPSDLALLRLSRNLWLPLVSLPAMPFLLPDCTHLDLGPRIISPPHRARLLRALLRCNDRRRRVLGVDVSITVDPPARARSKWRWTYDGRSTHWGDRRSARLANRVPPAVPRQRSRLRPSSRFGHHRARRPLDPRFRVWRSRGSRLWIWRSCKGRVVQGDGQQTGAILECGSRPNVLDAIRATIPSSCLPTPPRPLAWLFSHRLSICCCLPALLVTAPTIPRGQQRSSRRWRRDPDRWCGSGTASSPPTGTCGAWQELWHGERHTRRSGSDGSYPVSRAQSSSADRPSGLHISLAQRNQTAVRLYARLGAISVGASGDRHSRGQPARRGVGCQGGPSKTLRQNSFVANQTGRRTPPCLILCCMESSRCTRSTSLDPPSAPKQSTPTFVYKARELRQPAACR